MSIFFVQYEIRPLAESDDFADCGGAFINCFVQADNEELALERIQRYFAEIKWSVVSLEEGPFISDRDDFLDDDEWLAAFDQASVEGESYVLHIWPNEVQEDDVIH